MKTLILAFCIFSGFGVFGQGIEFFQGSWKDAMEKAKKEEKLLFVDAFAKWCGPCKSMAKNVFTQEKVGEFFNNNFINLKLDMEEADGITFGHKYPVSAYPTLIFLNGEGQMVHKVVGGQNAEKLIALGEEASAKLDRSAKYAVLYEQGDRSYDLMYNYVKALNQSGKSSLKIANEYLASQPSMSEEQRLKFILEAASESDSKLFEEVLAKKAAIIKLVGEDYYEMTTKKACQATVNKAINFETEELLTLANTNARKAFPREAPEFSAEANYKYYKSLKEDQKFIPAYQNLAKINIKNPDKLKSIVADLIKNHKGNEKIIKDAISYSESIYKLKNDFESLSLLCSTLVIADKTNQAIAIVEKVLKNNKLEENDKKNYDSLLRFLQQKV